MLIVLLDFYIFYQIFLSPQAKWNLIISNISNKRSINGLLHKLRLIKLGNIRKISNVHNIIVHCPLHTLPPQKNEDPPILSTEKQSPPPPKYSLPSEKQRPPRKYYLPSEKQSPPPQKHSLNDRRPNTASPNPKASTRIIPVDCSAITMSPADFLWRKYEKWLIFRSWVTILGIFTH